MVEFRSGIDYRGLSVEQVDNIESATDTEALNRDEMRFRLDETLEQFIHDHYDQQLFSSPARLEKEADRIYKAAAKLLKRVSDRDQREGDARSRLASALGAIGSELEAVLAVGMGGSSKLDALLDYLKRDTGIEDFLSSVERLEQAAEEAIQRMAPQKTDKKCRHQGNTARSALLKALWRIYKAHFQNCGIAVISAKKDVGGRFISYTDAVLKAAVRNLSAAVTESDPSIIKTLGMTPNTIRQAVRRIDLEQAQADDAAILDAGIVLQVEYTKK
ncbi:MAG: hypothetical protein IPG66_11780 [Hydrogenophilales bacterium]|nr:hypothetical protein [Hydrogenophilales bacterium]